MINLSYRRFCLVPVELRSSAPPELNLRLVVLLLLLGHHHLFVFVAAFQTVQLILIAGDVGFSPASRFDTLRYLPHGVLVQVGLKVVEELDDFLVLPELVRTLLEAFHVDHYVVLLPTFRKVYGSIRKQIRISDVNKS